MADNTANIGFEKQIWDAACVLRGNIDASEYESAIDTVISQCEMWTDNEDY